MKRTDEALNWLINATMVDGAEFPDACGRAARMFRVSYDKLRAAYDEYGARKVTKCREGYTVDAVTAHRWVDQNQAKRPCGRNLYEAMERRSKGGWGVWNNADSHWVYVNTPS